MSKYTLYIGTSVENGEVGVGESATADPEQTPETQTAMWSERDLVTPPPSPTPASPNRAITDVSLEYRGARG
ncbi:hypothetical protein FQN50_001530 [Emmonsiellopsis sp. PD_5]|nr:hypothetical protein FQN50_001530 [Emmonsiellopsis sp. PD_5]